MRAKLQCYKGYKVTTVTMRRGRHLFNDVTFVTILTLFNHIDVALHVKVLFRHIVMFTIENFFEAAHGVRDRDVLPFRAGEHFGYVKRLAKETLNFSRTVDGELVLGT